MFGTVYYKGWEVRFDPPPIPVRDFDWVAIHPNYEGWVEEGEYVSNGLVVHAPSKTALRQAIDAWELENA